MLGKQACKGGRRVRKETHRLQPVVSSLQKSLQLQCSIRILDGIAEHNYQPVNMAQYNIRLVHHPTKKDCERA